MSHRYVRPAIQEQVSERWERRAKASILTASVMTLLLWAASRPAPEPQSDVQQGTPILVTLIPLPKPEPVDPPPVPPPPPPPLKPKHDVGGQRRRQAPVPLLKPALAPLAPAHAELVDSTRFPVTTAFATADPVTPSPLAGTDPVAGGQGLAAGTGDDAGPGTGSGVGSGSGEIDILRRATWVWKPTDEALSRFAPPLAVAQHVSGKAIIACRVRLSTQVHDCRIVAESAGGFGFGSAAIDASRIFRVRPPRRNGKPLDDAWVGIPVLWISKTPPAMVANAKKK